MAESIVSLLRRLAGSRGLMVLATIHSPSSQVRSSHAVAMVSGQNSLDL